MSSVTVVIPVRNGSRFLGAALRSVLRQSRPPEEIIVVDDDSVEIVAREAPSARRLRGMGRGPAAARNMGIRAARGDFVAFIDHDDCWTPDRLACHAALLDTDSSLDAVLGATQWTRPSDEPDRLEPLGDPFPAMSFGALTVRRAAFERVGLLDESLGFSEDVAWIACARSRGLRLRVDPRPVQLHRRHGANRTRDAASNRHGFLRALRAAARSQREIAVIVSVRNGERFIGAALESIAAQSLAPAEVLVVDGRSEDRTREIVARFPFARCIERDPLGVADANNAGVAATRSPLVSFLSHDDRWHDRKLEWQADRLLGDPALDFVVGKAVFELEPGCEAPRGFRSELLERPTTAYILETLLVRRAFFDRVGPFDPSLRSAEDVDWFARARHAGGRGAAVDAVVVRKRVHDRNTSLDAAANTARLLRVVRSAVARSRSVEEGA